MIQKYLLKGFEKVQVASNQKKSLITKLFTFVIVLLAFIFTGCQSPPEPIPHIPNNYSPQVVVPPEVDHWVLEHPIETPSNIPRNWYPQAAERNWSVIIIHHSATETGNMALFDREHKDRGWDGVGYDFVIGNGSDSGDGQVEVTYRWRDQLTGAHCKTPNNWTNENGIGICLVGNFDDKRPTKRQMDTLVKLTDFLQKRYSIPQSRIYGHGSTPGAIVTDCPGRLFPMAQFKSSLNF